VVEVDLVGHLLGEVDDVIQRRGQGEDVLPLDRRDEGLVDQPVDLVGDVVRLVLEITETGMTRPTLEQALAQLHQGVVDERALLCEEVVKATLLRNQAESHEATSAFKRTDRRL